MQKKLLVIRDLNSKEYLVLSRGLKYWCISKFLKFLELKNLGDQLIRARRGEKMNTKGKEEKLGIKKKKRKDAYIRDKEEFS